MKKIIGLLAFIIFTGNAYAQEINQKNVPAVVLNAFQLKFAQAADVNWKLDKGDYHVDFELNGKEHELVMSDRGILLRHLQDLYTSEIPKAVLSTIQSKVAFFDVNDADRTEEGSKISYKIVLKISDKKHEFITDESGKLLKYTRELKDSEVPVAVMNVAKTDYNGFEVRDADLTEEGGKVMYILQLKKSNEKVRVIFDPEGKIIEVRKG